MFQMQYFVPEGYPRIEVPFDAEFAKMCGTLKGVDKKGAKIPNSALSVQLSVMVDGASLEIKKRDHLVSINIFCYEPTHFASVFALVEKLYSEYNLGIPKRPKTSNWIHAIPVAYDQLRENEVILCKKLTQTYFWAVFYQILKKRNPMN